MFTKWSYSIFIHSFPNMLKFYVDSGITLGYNFLYKLPVLRRSNGVYKSNNAITTFY